MSNPLYVLDTDICVYWLKGDKRIEERIVDAGLPRVRITAISNCELYYGAYKSSRPRENLRTLARLNERVETLHTSDGVAPVFGRLKADLELQGTRLDDADLLIAATAMCSNAILISNNSRHFQRVPELRLENWAPPES